MTLESGVRCSERVFAKDSNLSQTSGGVSIRRYWQASAGIETHILKGTTRIAMVRIVAKQSHTQLDDGGRVGEQGDIRKARL